MSDEMAVTDNATGEDAKSNSEETATESAVEAEVAPTEVPPEPEDPPVKEDSATVPKEDDLFEKLKMLDSSNFPPLSSKDQEEELTEEKPELDPEPAVIDQTDGAAEKKEPFMKVEIDEEKRGVKRRASAAFSENGGEDFKGFDFANPSDLTDYSRVLKRLEAEVTAASKDFTPVRNVMATPSAPSRASKRARQDTDGSRPSSAMSSRSDEIVSSDVAASPLSRGRRTSEMSSPLLRVPLERGWRRELVYRAALDAHSRRNADIYYYSPTGKKLRSTREVSEQLSGTGLTLENFSFFKEPLGVDDPEKEIIRDAKMIRRVESPVAAAPPALEGKRAPKPKQPKGASPEPNTPNTPKSPPAKLKVKSVGSRLSGPPAPVAKPVAKKPAAAAADNNNSAAWKKPRPPQAVAAAATGSATVAATGSATGSATAVSVAVAATVASVANVATAVVTPPPPPLLSRPPLITSPEERCAPARQVVQPCSLTCGRGVPSLACAACLCLYHPYCAGHTHTDAPQPFYCKNCRKSTSPASEPPPLTHKSGVASAAAALPAPVPRRVPVPVPVPVLKRPEKRVLLRMKAASGGPEGERVWAVAQAHAAAKPPPRASLPQSLVRLNGRRFIVVGRALVQPRAKSIDE